MTRKVKKTGAKKLEKEGLASKLEILLSYVRLEMVLIGATYPRLRS